jgi:response regulator RpfG family c-di-GMP phosphodiesterase
MTYTNKTLSSRVTAHDNGAATGQEIREPLVLVVEDGIRLSEAFGVICKCLSVAVERMPSRDDLGSVLRNRRPMAVIAEMDAAGQDGCHVLMTIATHDRGLPVLLITGPDPAVLGAVDAVEEVWELSSVEKWQELLGAGAMVDFLFRAGRKGRCMRLMSV